MSRTSSFTIHHSRNFYTFDHNPATMRDAMLFIHFLGLILGLGAGFASLFIGSANKNLSKEERQKFILRLRALGYMGLTGIALLIISGGYLATPYWPVIGTMPLFISKLSLVVVLLTLT